MPDPSIRESTWLFGNFHLNDFPHDVNTVWRVCVTASKTNILVTSRFERRANNLLCRLINFLAALAAYTLKPRKPSINLKAIEKSSLIPNQWHRKYSRFVEDMNEEVSISK